MSLNFAYTHTLHATNVTSGTIIFFLNNEIAFIIISQMASDW